MGYLWIFCVFVVFMFVFGVVVMFIVVMVVFVEYILVVVLQVQIVVMVDDEDDFFYSLWIFVYEVGFDDEGCVWMYVMEILVVWFLEMDQNCGIV